MSQTIEPKENIQAWQHDTYPVWVARFGLPAEIADKLKKDPGKMAGSMLRHFGSVENKRILNIMGSNGLKAVALALLGADVTVIDVSESSRNYAMDAACAAGVKIDYLVEDVLAMAVNQQYHKRFDIVFAEMGILHYFTDLAPIMNIVKSALDDNGIFLIKDFHPISTKLIKFRGTTAKVRKYKVDGDYFSEELECCPVSYSKHLKVDGQAPANVYLRKWTLGEIVTATASTGMRIVSLLEEPNDSSDVFDKGIPKTFTLKAISG